MNHFNNKLSLTICGAGGSKPPTPPPPIITQYPSVLSPPQLGNLTSISSFSYAKMIDLLSDGPIEGLVNKNHQKVYDLNIFEGIFLNDTPIKETSNYKLFSTSANILKSKLKSHFANKIISTNTFQTEIFSDLGSIKSPSIITSYHPDFSIEAFVSMMQGDINLIPLIKKSFNSIQVKNFKPFLTVINLSEVQIPISSPALLLDISEEYPLTLYIPNLSNHIYFPIGYDSLNSFNYFEMPRSFVRNSKINKNNKKTFEFSLKTSVALGGSVISATNVQILIWSLYEEGVGMMDISVVLDKYFNDIYAIKNNPSLYNYNLVSSEFKNGSEIQIPLSNFCNIEIDTDYRKELVGPFKLTNTAYVSGALLNGGLERLCSFYGKFPDSNLSNQNLETSDDIRYIKTWPVEFTPQGDPFLIKNAAPNYSAYDQTSSSRTAQDAVPVTHYIDNANVESVYVTIGVDQLYDTNHIDLVANNTSNIAVGNKYINTDTVPTYTKTYAELNGVSAYPGQVICKYFYLLLKDNNCVFDVSSNINGGYVNLRNFYEDITFQNAVKGAAASKFENIGYNKFGGFPTSSYFNSTSVVPGFIPAMIPYDKNALCFRDIFYLCNLLSVKVEWSNTAAKAAGLGPFAGVSDFGSLLDTSRFGSTNLSNLGSKFLANFIPAPISQGYLDKGETISNLQKNIFTKKETASPNNNWYCFSLNSKQNLIADDLFLDVSSSVTPSVRAYLDSKFSKWSVRRLTYIDSDSVSFARRAIISHVINYAIKWTDIFKNWDSTYGAVRSDSLETTLSYISHPFIYKYIYEQFITNAVTRTINNIEYKSLDNNKSSASPLAINQAIKELVLIGINGSYVRSKTQYWTSNIINSLDYLEDLLSRYLFNNNNSSFFNNVNFDVMDQFSTDQNSVPFFQTKLKTFNYGKLLGSYSVYSVLKISLDKAKTYYTQQELLADSQLVLVTNDVEKTIYSNKIYLDFVQNNTIETSDKTNDFIIYYNLYQPTNNTLNTNVNAGSVTFSAGLSKAQQSITAGTRLPTIVRLKVETGYEQKEFCNFLNACEYFSYDYSIFGMSTESSYLDLGRSCYSYLNAIKSSNDAGGYTSTLKSSDSFTSYQYDNAVNLIKVKVVKNGVETNPLDVLNKELCEKFLFLCNVKHNNYTFNCINSLKLLWGAKDLGSGIRMPKYPYGYAQTMKDDFSNTSSQGQYYASAYFPNVDESVGHQPINIPHYFFPYGNLFVDWDGLGASGTMFLAPHRKFEIYGLCLTATSSNSINTSGFNNIMELKDGETVIGFKVKPSGFKLFETCKDSSAYTSSLRFLPNSHLEAFGANDSYLNPTCTNRESDLIKVINQSGAYEHSCFTNLFNKMLYCEKRYKLITGYDPTEAALFGTYYNTDCLLMQYILPEPHSKNNTEYFFNDCYKYFNPTDAFCYLKYGTNGVVNKGTYLSGRVGFVFAYSGDPFLTGGKQEILYTTGILSEPFYGYTIPGGYDCFYKICDVPISEYKKTFSYDLYGAIDWIYDTSKYSAEGKDPYIRNINKIFVPKFSVYYNSSQSTLPTDFVIRTGYAKSQNKVFNPYSNPDTREYPVSLTSASCYTRLWTQPYFRGLKVDTTQGFNQYTFTSFTGAFKNTQNKDIDCCYINCSIINIQRSVGEVNLPYTSYTRFDYYYKGASEKTSLFTAGNDIIIPNIKPTDNPTKSDSRIHCCDYNVFARQTQGGLTSKYYTPRYDTIVPIENFLLNPTQSETSSLFNSPSGFDSYRIEEDENNYVQFDVYSYSYNTYKRYDITPTPITTVATKKDFYITFFYEETSVFWEMYPDSIYNQVPNEAGYPLDKNISAGPNKNKPIEGWPLLNALQTRIYDDTNKYVVTSIDPLFSDDALTFLWKVPSESFPSVLGNCMGLFGMKISLKPLIDTTTVGKFLENARHPFSVACDFGRTVAGQYWTPTELFAQPYPFFVNQGIGASWYSRHYCQPVIRASANKEISNLFLQCIIESEAGIISDLRKYTPANWTDPNQTLNWPDIYQCLANKNWYFNYGLSSYYKDWISYEEPFHRILYGTFQFCYS